MSDVIVPTASILRISDEKTMQLLDLYCQQECLWNTNDEFYKDQMHRRRAAEKIATALEIPFFGPRHVTMKFKNLRNAYSQELKKIARSEMAGMGYRPSVFWFKKMDSFIRPHLQKPRGANSRSSLVCQVEGTEDWLQVNPPITSYVFTTEIEEQTSENDSSDSQRKRKLDTPNPTSSKIHRLDSDSDEPKFIEISVPQCSDIETNTNDSSKILVDQNVKDYIDEQHKTVINTFKDLSSSIRAISARDYDVFESFGKYVAGLLRSLPRKRALEVQPRIVNLITEAGLDSILNNEKAQDCQSVVVKIEQC